jgi:hypothetical protein
LKTHGGWIVFLVLLSSLLLILVLALPRGTSTEDRSSISILMSDRYRWQMKDSLLQSRLDSMSRFVKSNFSYSWSNHFPQTKPPAGVKPPSAKKEEPKKEEPKKEPKRYPPGTKQPVRTK